MPTRTYSDRRYILVHDPIGYGPWMTLVLVILFGVALGRLVPDLLLRWCERRGGSCGFETGWRWSPYVAVVCLGANAVWVRGRRVYDITP